MSNANGNELEEHKGDLKHTKWNTHQQWKSEIEIKHNKTHVIGLNKRRSN